MSLYPTCNPYKHHKCLQRTFSVLKCIQKLANRSMRNKFLGKASLHQCWCWPTWCLANYQYVPSRVNVSDKCFGIYTLIKENRVNYSCLTDMFLLFMLNILMLMSIKVVVLILIEKTSKQTWSVYIWNANVWFIIWPQEHLEEDAMGGRTNR